MSIESEREKADAMMGVAGMSKAARARYPKPRDPLDMMEPEEMAVFLSVDPSEALRLLHDRRIPSFRVGKRLLRVDPIDAALYRLAPVLEANPAELYKARMRGLLPDGVEDRAVALLAERPRYWPINVLPAEGSIYLVETAEGLHRVKVGFSTDVPARLKALQTGSPVRLQVRVTWPGTMADERRLQAALAPHRLLGEWFDGAAIAEAERIMEDRR